MNELAIEPERMNTQGLPEEGASATRWWLPGGISALALAAGVIHLLLVYVLFGSAPPPAAGAPAPSGPPPGASPNPLFMYLPYLFVLNFLGFSLLTGLFLLVRRASLGVRLAVDALLGLMTVATLWGWNSMGRPNPHGLGTVALVVEVALLVALLAHVFALRRQRAAPH
jgi:hypothetical protein